jgi:hypothetical protein
MVGVDVSVGGSASVGNGGTSVGVGRQATIPARDNPAKTARSSNFMLKVYYGNVAAVGRDSIS